MHFKGLNFAQMINQCVEFISWTAAIIKMNLTGSNVYNINCPFKVIQMGLQCHMKDKIMIYVFENCFCNTCGSINESDSFMVKTHTGFLKSSVFYSAWVTFMAIVLGLLMFPFSRQDLVPVDLWLYSLPPLQLHSLS